MSRKSRDWNRFGKGVASSECIGVNHRRSRGRCRSVGHRNSSSEGWS